MLMACKLVRKVQRKGFPHILWVLHDVDGGHLVGDCLSLKPDLDGWLCCSLADAHPFTKLAGTLCDWLRTALTVPCAAESEFCLAPHGFASVAAKVATLLVKDLGDTD